MFKKIYLNKINDNNNNNNVNNDNDIDIDIDIFNNLKNGYIYEDIVKGRKGTTIVKIRSNPTKSNNILIPIVRTTTKYKKPVQSFNSQVDKIICEIKKELNMEMNFNNALLEIYTNEYKTMGFHSDQAQDLEDDSYIALFSCYNNPDTKYKRVLCIQKKLRADITCPKNKDDNKEDNKDDKNIKNIEDNIESMNIELDNNSVVIFSTKTNKEYIHKIELKIKDNCQKDDTEWLGLTMRLSKTFIEFKRSKPTTDVLVDQKKRSDKLIPYFYNTDNELKLIDNNDSKNKEYYKMRGEENKTIDFSYPFLDFTLSPSDILSLASTLQKL